MQNNIRKADADLGKITQEILVGVVIRRDDLVPSFFPSKRKRSGLGSSSGNGESTGARRGETDHGAQENAGIEHHCGPCGRGRHAHATAPHTTTVNYRRGAGEGLHLKR